MENPQPRSTQRLNGRALIISLVFALSVWAAIRLSDDYSSIETIDLEYVLPVGATFAQEPPRQIEATVTARGWDLIRESFRGDNRRILIDSVDLKRSPDGILSIRREVANAFARERIRVDALTDTRIVVRTEKLATKRVPLVLRSDIEYSSGFSSAGQPRLSVDSVVITGPRSRIAKLEIWYTDTLKLRGVSDSMRASVGIQLDDASVLQVSPTTTDVLVGVQQYTEAEFYVPVQIEGYRGPDSVAVFPAQVLLKCAVGLQEYNALSAQDFEVIIEFDNAEKSILRQLPAVVRRKPDYVSNVEVQPRLLEVFLVTKAPEEASEGQQ